MTYIAPIHPIEEKVTALKELWDGTNGISLRRKLNALIKEAPDLIEAYNVRHDILQHEDNICAQDREAKRAYAAVIEYYFPNEQFPDKMEWFTIENRPILKAIYNYAVSCWVPREMEKSVELFQLLLKLNPSDNQGARFCLLGILEGMSQHHFFHKMDQSEMLDWFQKESGKYPLLDQYNGEGDQNE